MFAIIIARISIKINMERFRIGIDIYRIRFARQKMRPLVLKMRPLHAAVRADDAGGGALQVIRQSDGDFFGEIEKNAECRIFFSYRA